MSFVLDFSVSHPYSLGSFSYYYKFFEKAREYADDGKFIDAKREISVFLSKFPDDKEALNIKSVSESGLSSQDKINQALKQNNFLEVSKIASHFLAMFGKNSRMEKILNQAKLVLEITDANASKDYTKAICLVQKYIRTYGEFSYVNSIKADAEKHVNLAALKPNANQTDFNPNLEIVTEILSKLLFQPSIFCENEITEYERCFTHLEAALNEFKTDEERYKMHASIMCVDFMIRSAKFVTAPSLRNNDFKHHEFYTQAIKFAMADNFVCAYWKLTALSESFPGNEELLNLRKEFLDKVRSKMEAM